MISEYVVLASCVMLATSQSQLRYIQRVAAFPTLHPMHVANIPNLDNLLMQSAHSILNQDASTPIGLSSIPVFASDTTQNILKQANSNLGVNFLVPKKFLQQKPPVQQNLRFSRGPQKFLALPSLNIFKPQRKPVSSTRGRHIFAPARQPTSRPHLITYPLIHVPQQGKRMPTTYPSIRVPQQGKRTPTTYTSIHVPQQGKTRTTTTIIRANDVTYLATEAPKTANFRNPSTSLVTHSVSRPPTNPQKVYYDIPPNHPVPPPLSPTPSPSPKPVEPLSWRQEEFLRPPNHPVPPPLSSSPSPQPVEPPSWRQEEFLRPPPPHSKSYYDKQITESQGGQSTATGPSHSEEVLNMRPPLPIPFQAFYRDDKNERDRYQYQEQQSIHQQAESHQKSVRQTTTVAPTSTSPPKRKGENKKGKSRDRNKESETNSVRSTEKSASSRQEYREIRDGIESQSSTLINKRVPKTDANERDQRSKAQRKRPRAERHKSGRQTTTVAPITTTLPPQRKGENGRNKGGSRRRKNKNTKRRPEADSASSKRPHREPHDSIKSPSNTVINKNKPNSDSEIDSSEHFVAALLPPPNNNFPQNSHNSNFYNTVVQGYSSGKPTSKVHKHVFIHAAPEAYDHRPRVRVIKPEVEEDEHMQIIFVKSPTEAPPPKTVVQLPPAKQPKTIVYVLSKKPEDAEDTVKVIQPPSQKPPSPEIYFIRYGDRRKNQGYPVNDLYSLNSYQNIYKSASNNEPTVVDAPHSQSRGGLPQSLRQKRHKNYGLELYAPLMAYSSTGEINEITQEEADLRRSKLEEFF